MWGNFSLNLSKADTSLKRTKNFVSQVPALRTFCCTFCHQNKTIKFCWFFKFLFYDLYFEFCSLSVLYIYYSLIHLYIRYSLWLIVATTLLFMPFCSFMFTIVAYQKGIHPWLKSDKFFNPSTPRFHLSFFQWLICLKDHSILIFLNKMLLRSNISLSLLKSS